MYVPIHQVPTQVCSAVDERHTRRHEDIKMTQRRHKPIATPRRKASGAPKKNSTMKRGMWRLEDMKPTPRRQQTMTRRTIFEAKKCFLRIDFVPDLTPYWSLVRWWWAGRWARPPRGLLVPLRPFSWPTLVPRSSFRLPCVVRRSSGLAVGRRDGKKGGFGRDRNVRGKERGLFEEIKDDVKTFKA